MSVCYPFTAITRPGSDDYFTCPDPSCRAITPIGVQKCVRCGMVRYWQDPREADRARDKERGLTTTRKGMI